MLSIRAAGDQIANIPQRKASVQSRNAQGRAAVGEVEIQRA
jgi:hypothetical protein